jgi:hypothetical protein
MKGMVSLSPRPIVLPGGNSGLHHLLHLRERIKVVHEGLLGDTGLDNIPSILAARSSALFVQTKRFVPRAAVGRSLAAVTSRRARCADNSFTAMTIRLTAMTYKRRIDVVDGHGREYKKSNVNYSIASSLRRRNRFVSVDDLQLEIKHALVRKQNHSLPGTLKWSDGVRKDARVEDYQVAWLVFHPVLNGPAAEQEMSACEFAEWCYDDKPMLVIGVVCMQQYPEVLKRS